MPIIVLFILFQFIFKFFKLLIFYKFYYYYNKYKYNAKNIVIGTGSIPSSLPDLKIDEEYIKTGIGGFTHRHFDDHAFHLMWQKVKETLPNDTKFEEIKNYFISMSKDLQTPMGIPLHKINDKEFYEQLASYLSKNFFFI